MRILATCRPVDWASMRALLPDLPETPVYPGSIQGACEHCGVAVWIGPKAQAVPDAEVVCFRCTMDVGEDEAAQGYALPVINLGNTYLPRQDPP